MQTKTERLKRNFSIERKMNLMGWVFVAPSLLVIAFIVLYPIGYTLVLSLCSKDLLNPENGTRFVGLANFRHLFGDPIYLKALGNNIFLTVASVALQLVLGMMLALLLNKKFFGRAALRGISILPWAMPTFVASFVWMWMMNPQHGTVNIFLKNTGLVDKGIPFFTSSKLAIFSMLIPYVWKGLPWVVMVLLSGLQMVQLDQQEAARIDGANRWQEFWHVVVPNIYNVILVVILLRTIWTFNWFEYLYLITGGGPLDTTMTWPIQVYNLAFKSYRVGRASALGVLIFLVMIVFSAVYFKVLGREEDEL